MEPGTPGRSCLRGGRLRDEPRTGLRGRSGCRSSGTTPRPEHVAGARRSAYRTVVRSRCSTQRAPPPRPRPRLLPPLPPLALALAQRPLLVVPACPTGFCNATWLVGIEESSWQVVVVVCVCLGGVAGGESHVRVL